MQLSDIKGFGPKRLELLKELNIRSVHDLLYYFPRSYLHCREISKVQELNDGEAATVKVTTLAAPTIFYNKGKTIVSVRCADDTGRLTVRWMNQPYRMQQVQPNTVCYFHGRVSKKRGTFLYNPQTVADPSEIVPVYDLCKGLTQKCFREAVAQCLQGFISRDPALEQILHTNGYPGLAESLRQLHIPTEIELLAEAKKSLSFLNAFLYFLAAASFSEQRLSASGIAFRTEGILNRFCEQTPFQPTASQISVLTEVAGDMASHRPMNRLIQGDVGSGKTLIAEFALFVAHENGMQGAMLAPTELLARQHEKTLRKRFGDSVILYVGSLTAKEKAEQKERIRTEPDSVVVGTHALISDDVIYSNLGVIVTDEQHRFGVLQRAKMEGKAIRPDILVMSATPIPRTLALMMYADLNLSVIGELPQGRKLIQTHFVPSNRRDAMYRHLINAAENDERAYVVCPLIEPTEGYEGLSVLEIYEELHKKFPDAPIAVLHGRMKESEKSTVMESFRHGIIKILISTTVVEVGVDVREATSMVIEGCDHFGLSTLHQLRGRVGRNTVQSHCYLLCSQPSKNARERIATIVSSNDGFEIAQRDMELRGHGDLFGVRQSGEGRMDPFRSSDYETLERAAAAAKETFLESSLQSNELIALARDRYRIFDHISNN